MGGNLGTNVPGLVAFLGRPRGLLALMPVIAAAVALGVSLAQPERFDASADVWFGRTTDATSLVARGAGVATDPEPDAAKLALATLDTAAARVKRRLPGAGTVEQLRRAVDARFRPNSGLLTVTAEAGDAVRAARLANAFADEIVALYRETARAEVQRTIDVLSRSSLSERVTGLELLKALETGDVQVVGRAIAPPSASSPKPLRNALLAALAGLIAGLLGAALRVRRRDRLRDEDELAELVPAPVLGRIPQARVGREDPAFDEAFELLAVRLQLLERERGGLVLAVTSAADGSGTTTVVGRLTWSLASQGDDDAEFTLVDAAPVTGSAAASAVATTADGVLLVVDLARTRRGELLAATRQLRNACAELVGIVLNRAPAASLGHVRREPARVEDELGPPTFAT